MTKWPVALASVLIAGLAINPAFATSYSGTCAAAPEEQWMTEAAIQAKISEGGYNVSKLKRTRRGNCYEAYVTDKSGKRLELFLDPTNGNIIHSE
jgi:hypothetical protein